MDNLKMLLLKIEQANSKKSFKTKARTQSIRELGKLCRMTGCLVGYCSHIGNHSGYKVFKCSECGEIQVYEGEILIDSSKIRL